jgi:hypothetical protein
MTDPMTTSIDGAAPEPVVVRDMLRRAVWAAPALIVVFGLIWGVAGALSTAYAIALVCVNFALAAFLSSRAARISVAALGAAAMFGFLLRLAIIFVAVLAVRDAWWVSLVPLGLTLVVTHLGLLFWEMRYISASLAFPALKPAPAGTPPKESATP